MADNSARLEVIIGSVSFKGEGDQSWLSGELQKVIEAAASRTISHHHEPKADSSGAAAEGTFTTSLASFLKEKSATSHKKKFLATARWLQRRGMTSLSTADVSKALKDNHQGRLTNPSQCLSDNTNSGFCEKDGKGFFITHEGLVSLGEAE
jgi:hypothetical protein